MSEPDFSYSSHVAAMSPINKLFGYLGIFLVWAGGLSVISSLGWVYLLPYAMIWLVFCHFIGVPSLLSLLRCASAFRGRAGSLLGMACVQAAFAFLMVWLLGLLGMQAMTGFFVLAGVVQSLAMPKAKLMAELRTYSL